MNFEKQSKVREAKTPQEMRAELERLQRFNETVHTIQIIAHRDQLSELDQMTMLAYYALKQAEDVKQAYADHLLTCPPPMFVMSANAVLNGSQEAQP